MQVLRVRGHAETERRVHLHAGGDGRGRGRAARALALHGDPHGRGRESARRLRLLRRHHREPARGAPRCASEVLHGERGPPHDEALGSLPRGGAGAAEGRRARIASRRRRRGLLRPRAPADRSGEGAP